MTQGDDSHLQTRERALEETNPVGFDTLIPDFHLLNCEKVYFFCVSHPVCVTLLWQP